MDWKRKISFFAFSLKKTVPQTTIWLWIPISNEENLSLQLPIQVCSCWLHNYELQEEKKQIKVKARMAFLPLIWSHREHRGYPNIFNPLQPGSAMRPGLSVIIYRSLAQFICNTSPVSIFLPYKEKDPNKPTIKHPTKAKTKQKKSLQRPSLLDFVSMPRPAHNFHKGKTNTKGRKFRFVFYTWK